MQATSFSLHPDNIEYINDQWKQKGKRNRSHWMDDLITHLRESKNTPSKVVVKKQEISYPSELNLESWNEWKLYRKEMKMKAYKPTPRSEGVAVKKLIEISGGDHKVQALIIKQSMENSWQGLFELRGSYATNQQSINATSNRKLTAEEERNAELLRKYGNANASSGWPVNQPSDTGVDKRQVQRGIYEQVEQEGTTIDLDSGDWSSDG